MLCPYRENISSEETIMSKGTTGDGMHIAILGAPGCVGQSLIKKFLENPEYTIIASYRTEHEIPKNVRDDRLVWKQVNLFDPAIPIGNVRCVLFLYKFPFLKKPLKLREYVERFL